jgi:hypothetical protein
MTAQTSISLLIVNSEHPTAEWPGRAQSVSAQVVEWIKTCVHYYRAAAAYETLRRLSDTELERRGLCRATLARSLCER